MNSKLKKTKSIFAITLAIAGTVFSVYGSQEKQADKNLDRNSKVLAASSAISSALSVNFKSVTSLMTEEAKKEWMSVLRPFNVDGSQLLGPDFCKVKYMMISKADDSGYVLGYYNPFYDSFLLFLLNDASRVSIDGVRLVTRGTLGGYVEEDKSPVASGTNAAVDYFPVLSKQVELAVKTFKLRFNKKTFRAEFHSLEFISDKDINKIKKVNELRIALAILMTEDKRLLRDSVLALSAVKNIGKISNGFLGKDGSTVLTLKKLSELSQDVRKSFNIVSWFATGDSRNIVFSNHRLPSLLILAHVEADARIWLRMYDAHTIVGSSGK